MLAMAQIAQMKASAGAANRRANPGDGIDPRTLTWVAGLQADASDSIVEVPSGVFNGVTSEDGVVNKNQLAFNLVQNGLSADLANNAALIGAAQNANKPETMYGAQPIRIVTPGDAKAKAQLQAFGSIKGNDKYFTRPTTVAPITGQSDTLTVGSRVYKKKNP
jgi:hypothetical protein